MFKWIRKAAAKLLQAAEARGAPSGRETSMVENFKLLSCGSPADSTVFGGIMTHLQSSHERIITEMLALPARGEEAVKFYGPFLGRSILEVAFTALIGRLDPFRLLVLREMQMRMSTTVEPLVGERFLAAVQWTGDVRPKEAEHPDLWAPTRPMEKIYRTLFGRYYAEIFWIPAFTAAVDTLTPSELGPWFDELRKIVPESFVPRLKAEVERTYSSLSKGIHHEFVIPPDAFYTAAMVLDLMNDALRLVAHLSLTCHFVPSSHFNLSAAEAMHNYGAAQNVESILCL